MRQHLIILLTLSVLITSVAFGQAQYRISGKMILDQQMPAHKIENHNLLYFQLIEHKKHLEFYWLARGERNSGNFFLTYSLDGVNYKIAVKKECRGTGINADFEHHALMEIPPFDSVYVKLVKAYPDKSYYESKTIKYVRPIDDNSQRTLAQLFRKEDK